MLTTPAAMAVWCNQPAVDVSSKFVFAGISRHQQPQTCTER